MDALDTNILARYYVEEDAPSHATRAQRETARRLLEHGGGVFVPKTVLLELEWVLRGVYRLPRRDVVRAFEHLLGLPNVEVEDRSGVSSALANLRSGLDFADALHHASSKACTAFLTFDGRRFVRRARRLALTPPVRVPA
jgi:predicted nucleic-acid-binding protein